jgi:MFS family permease
VADASHPADTPRNRNAILAFEMMWGVALPFIYYSTIVPGYLNSLGISKAWIGLVPALHSGALAIVQPLSAYWVPEDERRLRRMRGFYLGSALGYSLLGGAIFGGMTDPRLGLAATLAAELVLSLCIGMGDPQYMAIVVNAVSPALRGGFFGRRMVVLGLGGIAGGFAAEQLLKHVLEPLNFGACFLAGGLTVIASTQLMHFYRETPDPPQPREENLAGYLKERILGRAQEGPFRTYLIAVVLFSLSACAFPFLGLLVKERLNESDRVLGLLGSVFMAANMTQSWVLGYVCDRWGSRRGFGLSLTAYVAGLLGCLLLHDRTLLLGAYFLAAMWFPGQIIAATDLALRLAKDSPATEVTATMMLAMAPARIVGPLLIGAAIDVWSYPAPVLICAAFAAGALLVLWLGRRRSPDRGETATIAETTR